LQCDQWQGRALWPAADFAYIKTILGEWTDVIAYQISEERNRWLPRDLGI